MKTFQRKAKPLYLFILTISFLFACGDKSDQNKTYVIEYADSIPPRLYQSGFHN